MARSSSNRNSASVLASSVLPTPVGPRNRNEPVGRSGSLMPARERRTASDTAVTAACWPIRRRPSSSSIRRSLPVSPSSSRPVGMPVHAATTSAMSSAPTSSCTIDSPSRSTPPRLWASVELLFHGRDLGVEQPAGRLEVALALGPLGGDAHLVDALLDLADAVEALLLGLPALLERPQGLLLVGQLDAQLLQPVLAARRRSRSAGAAPPSGAGRRCAAARRSRPGWSRSPCAGGCAASSTRSIALSGSWRPGM